MFNFKQYSIEDSHSTMKVGTDAVLLGALVENNNPQQILDIGTGCGIIALMMAQRFKNANIDAIDIDIDSITQARLNFEQSPWSNRLHCFHTPLQEHKKIAYDLIVSNPPYFENSLKTPNAQRNLARHTDTLSIEELIINVNKLLSNDGYFWAILPYAAAEKAIKIAIDNNLYCQQKLYIHNKKQNEIKRTIFQLSKKSNNQIIEKNYAIRNIDNSYTDWYRQLTEPFYTHLK